MHSARSSVASLTGIWQGLYSYGHELEDSPFVATLLELGGAISGTTHEPCPTGSSSCGLAFAEVVGRREGRNVSFAKTYDGTSGLDHTVLYEGQLSADGTEIEGEWTIPGEASGRFMMIRGGGRKEGAALEMATAA
ncbi:MAG TPA: hypothetical protein VIO94_05610 [Phenylobacterium sp.]